MKNYHDIVLALAGVCQSAKLVHQLATESRADSDTFLTALNSLFITQPQRIEDVFGGEDFTADLALLREFGEFSRVSWEVVQEYGEVMMKEKAIETAKKYFK